MARIELLVIIAFAAIACSTEVDDSEQKKRGAGKTSLNTIPSGAQKPDYTYSIYSQNPSAQVSSSPSYQPQVSSSFYPTQTNQYYSGPVQQADQPYAPQPQINLLQPQTSSQFVPINFVPNPGFQSKYQIVPSKQNANIQLAYVPQSSAYPSQPLVQYPQYPQSLFAPPPTSPVGHHQNLYSSIPTQGQYNVGHNPFGNSYLGQPSMVLLAQPNPSLYNNFLYSNPVQSLYNYVPQNSQSRYGQIGQVSYSSPPSSDAQVSLTQNLSKEDNDVSPHTSDYTSAPSESGSSYKSAYATSRSSYSKL